MYKKSASTSERNMITIVHITLRLTYLLPNLLLTITKLNPPLLILQIQIAFLGEVIYGIESLVLSLESLVLSLK